MSNVRRSERSDKKFRIYPYLKSETRNRLEKLRMSISTQQNISIHDLAEDLLDMCMEAPEVINWIQNKYKVAPDHPMRVARVTTMGKSSLRHLYET